MFLQHLDDVIDKISPDHLDDGSKNACTKIFTDDLDSNTLLADVERYFWISTKLAFNG